MENPASAERLEEPLDDVATDAASEVRALLVGVSEVKANEDTRPVDVPHRFVEAVVLAGRAGDAAIEREAGRCRCRRTTSGLRPRPCCGRRAPMGTRGDSASSVGVAKWRRARSQDCRPCLPAGSPGKGARTRISSRVGESGIAAHLHLKGFPVKRALATRPIGYASKSDAHWGL